ncbi:MAG: FtsX-like permease family protein, partial [Gemmatimonadaceae bacterium]
PLNGGGPRTTMEADGRPMPAGAEPPSVDVRYASADYFKAMRIPLLAGRAIDARDRDGATARAVVSRETARLLWPGESAIGRRIVLKLNGGITADVIGVVADARIIDPRTPAAAAAYLPAGQFTGNSMDLMLRGTADEASLVAAMRAAVGRLDPTLPVYQIARMEALVDRATASERFTAVLLAAFALSSLLLAAVGIYGMCASDVARRRRELGIRLALGARPRSIVALVLRRGVANAAIGVAIGITSSLALTRAMHAILFGVSATDPVSFASVAALLLVIATVATLVPAIRAARIGPGVAMREE